MQNTDLTVAVVVERDGRFLIVEEQTTERVILSQPGGHIETGESPEEAVIRETREETAHEIEIGGLLGVYRWLHPQTGRQYLRIMFTGREARSLDGAPLDEGIIAVHWLSIEEIRRRQHELRSPAVLRCLEDYTAGHRSSAEFLSGPLPVQQNVAAVLANARLV